MQQPHSKNTDLNDATDTVRSYDFGFGSQYRGGHQRLLNRDGSFNILREGGSWNLYQWLVRLSWPKFWVLLLAFYIGVNLFFAGLFFACGPSGIAGSRMDTWGRLADGFFLSIQTFTSVGYGSLSPQGQAANVVASFCAFVGLMSFALATGLFFSRFSQATANILFSHNLLISPYKGGRSLQFRFVNKRKSLLMDLEVLVVMTWVDETENHRFARLNLERSTAAMLPLNWTIVHPINAESPLKDWNLEEMAAKNVEILITVRAHDEDFGQTIRSQYSYRWEEVVLNAHFEMMYYINNEGETILELDKINDFYKAI